MTTGHSSTSASVLHPVNTSANQAVMLGSTSASLNEHI